jgi:hypothetical protein
MDVSILKQITRRSESANSAGAPFVAKYGTSTKLATRNSQLVTENQPNSQATHTQGKTPFTKPPHFRANSREKNTKSTILRETTLSGTQTHHFVEKGHFTTLSGIENEPDFSAVTCAALWQF